MICPWELPTIRSVAVSPDGQWVATVVVERDENQHQSVLVALSLTDTHSSRRLATGRIKLPKWNPDSSRIGFSGVPEMAENNSDTSDIWSVSLDGALDQWTNIQTGVEDFDWSPDGDRLVFSAMTDRERHTGLDRGEIYSCERYPNKLSGIGRVKTVGRALFVVDEAGKVTGISDTTTIGYGTPMTGLSPSWGNDRIAFLADPKGVTDSESPGILLSRDVMTTPAPPADGAPTRLTNGRRAASSPTWGPNGQRLTFVAGNPTRPHTPTELHLVDDEHRVLTESLDNRVSPEGATWLDNTRLLVTVADTGRVIPAVCPISGKPKLIDGLPVETTVHRVDTGGNSIAICLSSSTGGMPVFAGSVPKSTSDLIKSLVPIANPLAPIAHQRDIPRPERIQWASGDFTVEGWFFAPDAPAPHPVVTLIHGGPVDVSSPGFDTTIEYFRDAGFAVFAPNYRGSISYGERFASAGGAPDWNGQEVSDILNGVSKLVSIGLAEPGRQFLLGGSHGGTVVAFVLAQSDKFAAAVSEHAVYDFRTAFGGTDATPRLEQAFGLPWEFSTRYEHVSPITSSHEINTPLLIATGERDRHAPPWQAESFYNRLRRRGVPCKLLIYPDTGHGISDPDITRRRLTQLKEWFRQHDPDHSPEKNDPKHTTTN